MSVKIRIFFSCLVLSHAVSFGHMDVHVLIAQLDAQIKVAPENADLYLKRANYLRQHNEFEKALLDLARVEELDARLPGRYYILAKIHLAREQWKPARAALDAFIAENAGDSEPYAMRSEALRHLGELNLAEQDARQAILLHRRAPLQLHLDYITLLLEQNDLEAALAAYTQAEESLGSLPVLLMEKARLFSDCRRFRDASATYARLRKLKPMLSFTCWNEEALMWAEHDPQKASEAVQQAKLAWNKLPQRQRAAMRDTYLALLERDIREME